jgi:hypothetical protein
LRVFESLVNAKTARGNCQLIYTTHSPFLINRNFPDRVKLVRKGDGSEGTQHVSRPAVRRFEPVRSALAIDAADTLFLGSVNVVMEGYADQKLLAACIQRFGQPGRLDELLDLNSCTLVAAGGAPFAARIVEKALRGDEKVPIVVVVLDGDAQGAAAQAKLAAMLDPKQACTLREVECGAGVFQVLEDLVPVAIVDRALHAFGARQAITWPAPFDGSQTGDNLAERIVTYCRGVNGGLAGVSDFEIRGGVVDEVVELLADETFHMAELGQLQANVAALCKHVNGMIEHAMRNANQRSLRSLVRQKVDVFFKRFPNAASKADLNKLLEDVRAVVFGHAEDFERTRQNVGLLHQRLNEETHENADPVDIHSWRQRLDRFKNQPWAGSADWSRGIPVQTNSANVASETQPTRDAGAPIH